MPYSQHGTFLRWVGCLINVRSLVVKFVMLGMREMPAKIKEEAEAKKKDAPRKSEQATTQPTTPAVPQHQVEPFRQGLLTNT